jgi:hypothetical protein
MNLQPTQHLNHEQLCDLLIGSQDNEDASSVLIARREASQEHLRDCLICASEFDLMRSSIAGFHDTATALADRELARRPIRPRFSPIYGAQQRGLITFAFVWATAALVIAAIIPMGLLNPKLNPMSPPDTAVTQSATSSEAQSDSDAALLDSIDEDLSAAIPTPMQPLAGPSAENTADPASTDIQDQNQRTN